jgi:hypothetical protein
MSRPRPVAIERWRRGAALGSGVTGSSTRRGVPDNAGSERITTWLSTLLARKTVKHQVGPGYTRGRTDPGTEVGGFNRCAQDAGPRGDRRAGGGDRSAASIVRIDGAQERRGVFEGFVDDLRGR